MVVIRCAVRDLTEAEYRQCYSLNFRSDGMMRWVFMNSRRGKCYDKAMVYRILDAGELIGWALAYETIPDTNYIEAHFYVRKRRRREGVGRLLRDAVYRDFPEHLVCVHDLPSKRFFRATDRY